MTRGDLEPLPWSEDPKEARRIYQRIYREAQKSSVEEALIEHLGLKPKRWVR